MGHQTATPVTDTFRRIIEEKFPTPKEVEAMSQSNNASTKPADTAVAAGDNVQAQNDATRKNITQLLFQASSAAGTPQFEADTKTLMDAIDKARIKVQLPDWKETATSAAIYGGVTALCMIGAFAVIRLLNGSGGGSSN